MPSGSTKILLALGLIALTASTFAVLDEAKSALAQNPEPVKASLDDTEAVEPVGIVGFSFKYSGDDYPRVGNILPEGPATRLDIKSGDEILAIDGHDTSLLSIQGARQMLTGKPGQAVKIKLRRAAVEQDIDLVRMSSTEVKDQRLRNMIEHYRSSLKTTDDAPLALCHLSEPGPSVVEFYPASAGKNPLLLEREKNGLSVKRVSLADQSNLKLMHALGLEADSKPIYYFAGILTTQGHFEKRPLTREILAENLKKINWVPGQDSMHKAMIEQYETLRKQTWQPSANLDSLSSNSAYRTRRNEAAQAMVKYLKLHNSGAVSSAAARAMLAPEALSLGLPPMGNLSFEQSEANNNIIIVGESYAVARTKLNSPKALDVYFYMRNDAGWKITAVRALACTGPLGAMVDELQHKSSKSRLSAEEEASLANLKLTLSTDSELKSWFKKNGPALDKLAVMAADLPAGSSVIVNDMRLRLQGALSKASPEVKEQLRALHISSLNKIDDKQMEFIIGGVTDNTVGFLYAPDNKPPLLGPSEYIWVEKVADKWYLFRTT
jgi:hypothetical protein